VSVVDGRHSAQFLAKAQDVHLQALLGLLLQNGIPGVDLGLRVVIVQHDLVTESLDVSLSERNLN
jgi:hypothetical protein